MAAGAGNEKKRKNAFSRQPRARTQGASSDLPERLGFQAKIRKSIARHGRRGVSDSLKLGS